MHAYIARKQTGMPTIQMVDLSILLLQRLAHFQALTLRPNILLVDPTTSHALHCLLGLLLRYPAFFLDDLAKCLVDLTGHVCGVTADVEVRFLLQEVVDELRVGGQVMLDVVLLLGIFTREGVEDLEFIAEDGFEVL